MTFPEGFPRASRKIRFTGAALINRRGAKKQFLISISSSRDSIEVFADAGCLY